MKLLGASQRQLLGELGSLFVDILHRTGNRSLGGSPGPLH